MLQDKLSTIIFTFMNLPRKLVSAFQLQVEDLLFNPLHSLLLKNWIPPLLMYVLMVWQSLQVLSVLFDPMLSDFWNSSIANNLIDFFQSFYIDRICEYSSVTELSLCSGFCLLVFFAVLVGFFIQRKRNSKSFIFLFCLRLLFETNRTVFVLPCLRFLLLNIEFPFRHSSRFSESQFEGTSLAFILTAAVFSFIGLLLYGYFLTFIYMSYTDVRVSNESPFSRNPNNHELYHLFFLMSISLLRLFEEKVLIKYLLLSVFIGKSLYNLSLHYSRIMYFSPIMQITSLFFSLLYFWTPAMMLASVIWNDGMNATIWLMGVLAISIVSIVFFPFVPRFSIDPHHLDVSNFLIFEEIASNLILYSKKSSRFFTVLQGYVSHHHTTCAVEKCPLRKMPTFQNRLTAVEHAGSVTAAFLEFISFLFKDHINSNYLFIELRLRYCLFLINFIKRNDLAVVELSILSQLEPSLQTRFLIYSLVRECVESKVQLNEKEASVASAEIQKFWIIRDCQSLNLEIERLCKKYIDFWTKVGSLSIDQDEMYAAASDLRDDLAHFDSFWNDLHPMSSSKHPKSLIKSGLFISNVMNQLERGRKIIERGMILYQEISSRGKNLDLVMLDTNLMELETAIIVISGNMDKPGVICDINTNALMMFGFLKEEVMGKNIKELMTTEVKSLHDDFLRKSVIKKSSKKFAKESIIYGRTKSKNLIAVRAVIKSFFQNEPFFIGKVISTNKNMWVSDVMVNSLGKMETFSDPAIRMLGLSLRDIDQDKDIDALLPQFNLFSGSIKEKEDARTLILPTGTFSITCQRYVYAQMAAPVYIFHVIKKHHDVQDEEIPILNPPTFSFVFNDKSQIILKDSIFDRSASLNGFEKSLRVDHESAFDFDIKTAKLSQGKVIKISESSDKSLDGPILVNIIEASTPSQNSRSFSKAENNFHSEISEELIERWVREYVRDTPLPVSASKLLTVLLLTSILFVSILFCGLILNSIKFDRVILINNISKYFFEIRSALMDVVSLIFYITNLKSLNPDMMIWNPNVNHLIFEQLEGGINEIYDNSNQYHSSMTKLFSTPMFSFTGYNSSEKLTYVEAVKLLIVDAFITVNTDYSLVGLDKLVQNRFVLNSMNEFWNKISTVQDRFMEFEWAEVNNYSFLWILFAIQMLLVFCESLFAFQQFKRIQSQISNEQVLLIEIDFTKMKQKIRSIQNFLVSMELEVRMEQLEPEDDERDKDFMLASKKRTFLKPSLQVTPLVLVICRIFFILGVIGFWVVFNLKKLNSVQVLLNEKSSTSTFKCNYHYVLNSFYTFVYDPSIPLNNTDSKTVLSQLISNLLSMDEDLTINQMIAMEIHSKEYQNFTQSLFLKPSCEFLEAQAETFKLMTSIEECKEYMMIGGDNDYVSDGLTVGLTKFSQSIFTSAQDFISNKRIESSGKTTCGDSASRFCFLDPQEAYINFMFVTKVMKDFSRLWISKLTEEFSELAISGQNVNEDLVFFLLLYSQVVWTICVVLLIFYLEKKMKNVRSLLKIIPTESLMLSPKLKDFFNIDACIRSWELDRNT